MASTCRHVWTTSSPAIVSVTQRSDHRQRGKVQSAGRESRVDNEARSIQDQIFIIITAQTFLEHWLLELTYPGDVPVAGASGRCKWQLKCKRLAAVFDIAMVHESHKE